MKIVKKVVVPPKKKSLIEEVVYLGEYETREALDADCDYWDASTAGQYAWCPRNAQYSHRMGLTQVEEALPLVTGSALHAGIDVLYSTRDEDLALQTVIDVFGDREPPAPSHSYAHLHAGFVEAIFKNYLEWSKKHDVFTPIVVHLDELDLSDVVAAVWKVLPDERVILGESKVVMRFDVEGNEFVLAGKPDLPAMMGNKAYIIDTKCSAGAFLSDWYFEKHVISNQFRGYCAMLSKLLKQRVQGALVNGIYAGEHALETMTKAGKPSKITRFTRYGPLSYSQAHLDEAIWNQYAWRQLAFVHQELAEQYPKSFKAFGYPQNTGKSCQGCSFLPICKTDPKQRLGVILKSYTQRRRQFLDL